MSDKDKGKDKGKGKGKGKGKRKAQVKKTFFKNIINIWVLKNKEFLKIHSFSKK